MRGGGNESSCYAGNCNEKSEGGVHRRSQKRFRRGRREVYAKMVVLTVEEVYAKVR